MKTTTTTFLKASLLLLFMALQGQVFSQTYYDLYIYSDGIGTLQPTAGTVIGATDQVIWTDTFTGAVPATNTYSRTQASPNLIVSIAQGFQPGLHTFTMVVRSAAGCDSDPSTAKTVFVLPASTLAFDSGTNPTLAQYCNYGSPSSTINATATPTGISLPAGIGYTYTWTVQKTVGATVTNPVITTVGTPEAANTTTYDATTNFDMTTISVGLYKYSVKAVYQKLTGNTGTLRVGSTPYDFPATGTKDVTVIQRPSTPTIEII